MSASDPRILDRIMRSIEQTERDKARAKAKRDEQKRQREEIERSGRSYRYCLDCRGDPEIHSAMLVPEPVMHPEDAIAEAKLFGRYRPDCEAQGAKRFRWKGPPIKYRRYRWLGTDLAHNFGGLETEESVIAFYPVRKKQFAMKPWQYSKDDVTEEQIDRDEERLRSPRERISFPRRVHDERQMKWNSHREARNETGVQRAPVELVRKTEKEPVPNEWEYNPNP